MTNELDNPASPLKRAAPGPPAAPDTPKSSAIDFAVKTFDCQLEISLE